MTQVSIGLIPHEAARSKFARFSRAISKGFVPRGHYGSPAAPPPCPANPISGRARPILDQRMKTTLVTSQERLTARKVVQSRAPARGNESLSAGRVLVPQHAAQPDYIGINGRHLNGFFAISMNSPSMSMVNFCCCVSSAPEAARGVTRRATPQPMRAAVWMEAGDHACL
jgi:hypothetical protein